MSKLRTKPAGILLMVLLIAAGSLLGCLRSLNSMYGDVEQIFANGADGDGICVKNDLLKRAECAVNMCTVARRSLTGGEALLTDRLSEAAGALQASENSGIPAMKECNDQLQAAMDQVYSALEATNVSDADEKQYTRLYAEFQSRADTIRHDPYNTAAAEYNRKTGGFPASVTKALTPAGDAQIFY
ncbi:MAG: hypothetical protein ACI4VM_00395 [Anaerovoracaceae bacterium]